MGERVEAQDETVGLGLGLVRVFQRVCEFV